MKLLTIEESSGPKNIYEFQTLTGEIEVEQRRRAAKFCDQLGKFSKQYERISDYIAKKCKILHAKAHDLADEYYSVGAEINHFSELLKTTEIPQIVNMYRRLSDMVIRNGDFTLHSGELMNNSMQNWFKFQRQEATSFKEAHWLRQESIDRYNAQKLELIKRKEKLFKRKDVSEWGVPAERVREAMDSLQDAEKAFELMLPNATRQVNYLQEESSYFTSQCFKEARRVVMVDYTMAREHFVDMGEQMHRHIYDVNLGWGQFLDFYSDLNNARKESDDAYVENNHIGEEIAEPDEQAVFNTDLYDGLEDNDFNQNRPASNSEVGETRNLLSDLQMEISKEEEEERAAKEGRKTAEESKQLELGEEEEVPQQITEELKEAM